MNTFGYVGGNPVGFVDPLGLIDWSMNQSIANAITGFGDGVYSALTFGFGDLQQFRDLLDIDGDIDKCSLAYKSRKYTGVAWGIATWWAAGLNGG